jgi:single-stranded DNA-binding protein
MNHQILENNKVYLTGTVSARPVFSHAVYGEGFYETELDVMRLSGQQDRLPLTISERLLSNYGIDVGSQIAILGQFRSFNRLENNKSRLVLSVFVRELLDIGEAPPNPNLIELTGFVCKPPIFRVTPFKREICDVLVAVNRSYNKSDYIPCISWGRNARFVGELAVGERINLVGRIQSRSYVKSDGTGGTEERTAYEVSVSRVMLAEVETVAENTVENVTENK